MQKTDNTANWSVARRAASVSVTRETSPNHGLGFFSARWYATADVIDLAEERERRRRDVAPQQRETEIAEVVNGSAAAQRFKQRTANIPADPSDVAHAAFMVAIIADASDPRSVDRLPAWAFPILAAAGITDEFPGKPLRSLNARANVCVHCNKGREAGALVEVPTTDGTTVLAHDRCYDILLQQTQKQQQAGEAAKGPPGSITAAPLVATIGDPKPAPEHTNGSRNKNNGQHLQAEEQLGGHSAVSNCWRSPWSYGGRVTIRSRCRARSRSCQDGNREGGRDDRFLMGTVVAGFDVS
jgi:hypothetical protein